MSECSCRGYLFKDEPVEESSGKLQDIDDLFFLV